MHAPIREVVLVDLDLVGLEISADQQAVETGNIIL